MACPALAEKIFWFSEDPNQIYIHRVLSHRGALRNVTNAGRDAVDADGAKDEGAGRGRRSRVVLTPRRWRQVRGKQFSRMTVANKPGHRGEHEAVVKTIARGMPGVPGVT